MSPCLLSPPPHDKERQLQLPVTIASLSFSLSLSLSTVIISGKDSDWLVWIIHPPQWESGTGPAWLTLQTEHGSVTTRGWGSDARHLEARATKSVCTATLHSGSSWISHHHRKMQTWKRDMKWADNSYKTYPHLCPWNICKVSICKVWLLPYIANKKCADMIKDPAREDYSGSSGWAI